MPVFYRYFSTIVKFIFIFFVLLFFGGAGAQNEQVKAGAELLKLDETTERVKANKNIRLLEDPEGKYSIEEVTQLYLDVEFMPTAGEIPNEGYTSSVYWVKLDVQNLAPEKTWLLELNESTIDNAILYTPNAAGKFTAEKVGRLTSSGGGGYFQNNFAFGLNADSAATKTFYMRVHSSGPLRLPITIWEQTAFEEHTRNTTLLMGLFSGIGVAILFFYFLQFIKYQESSYFYFVLFLLSMFFSVTSMAGLDFSSIWPEWSWWSRHSPLIFIGLSSISVLLLTKSFLDTRRRLPKTTRLFHLLIGVNFTLIFILFFSYESVRLLLPFALLASMIAVLALASVLWKSGILYARYFVVAAVLSIIGIGIFVFLNMGIFPLTMKNQLGSIMSVLTGILLFAFGLNDKAYVREIEKVERERKATERQRLAMESLKHATERKDELLAFTSHGLRTPLYGMIGIAESLQEVTAGRLPPAINSQLGMIVSSGKKLAHMINDILDFSKLKQNTLDIHAQPVEFKEIAENVLAVCGSLVKDKKIQLYHTVSSDLPKVIADPERVEQILYNLVGNSIKYTEAGEIAVSAKKVGKQIEISVRDTGTGIQEDRLPNLFEPFHKEMNEKEGQLEGVGIGLNITKRLVELQGGRLDVESELGVGTTFSFTLPVYIEENREELKPPKEAFIEELTASQLANTLVNRKSGKRHIRILVVEPDEINRQMLTYQLIKEGYKVTGAAEGKEAIQLLEDQPMDLIVLDWSLADMTGDELCRQVRMKHTLTELPILMLSDKEGVQEKTHAFTAGANDYLVKPCDKEEFLLRIETLANLRSLTQEITNLNYFLERNVKERTMALEITNMNLVTVNDEIQEIEKARNEMLSTISHELGTPITLIHSYIQAVKESLIDEKNPRYLDMIHNKLLLLERLTEDLVELGKYKSGNMTLRFQSVRLGNWLDRLIQGMESDVKQSGRFFEHVKIERKDWQNNLMLSIDVDRVDQVFSNVLWNAVKHTDSQEGKITISAEIFSKGKEGAVLEHEEFDAEVIIKVADTGCGIDEEVLPHIFDRFFKKGDSSDYKGSGLGLAIAKEIILSHKGEIWAESEKGKGSVFYIALPLGF
ncbi:signal transduction histidine kinase [Planomicrobium soli]|uniref:Circadian input-output histidine kinase CikA n=1 Tax=Planomicrobium soli TaxID=1176648 RepID=A0A2P8GCL5_9BACL|nr:ATP-binding protein [Planomicrobium soli]PSL31687.1 signal transduction histidine kinase [Planomicrobium soli]